MTPASGRAAPGHGDARTAWRVALALALLALAAGTALVGTSVWFLGAVALAGAGPMAYTFNFHHPAGLVRLMALLRTLGKYGERLAGHRAALIDQTASRTRLFRAIAAAPATLAGGWQLARADRLADYLDDVEDADFARLRAGFPLVASGAGAAVLSAATFAVAPAALPALLALGLAGTWLVRDAAGSIAGREARSRDLARQGAANLGQALTSLVPLEAEGRRAEIFRDALSPWLHLERERLGERKRLARLDGLLGLAGPLAAAAVLVAAWAAGARQEALLPPAFVAFAWLALGETAGGASRILLGAVRGRLAAAALAAETSAGPDDGQAEPARAVRRLTVEALQLATPDGRAFGKPVSLVAEAGRPVVVGGVSGVGKTTLLKAIAGWLPVPRGVIGFDGAATAGADRQRLVHLALHDAAVLSDTLRANLFADKASEAELWAALRAVELDGRVAAAGGLDAWIGQESLSLGEAQRLNLARAFLSPAPILLLDEPGEHLGAGQADRIMARLLDRLDGRIVIVAAHRALAPLAGAPNLLLGPPMARGR